MIYHVAIGFKEKSVSHEIIERALGASGWARYAPNCWIVDSSRSAKELSSAIRPLVATADSIFICEVNLNNNSGYLHKEIWAWINERK